jgi:hypothetical protein
MNLEELGVPLSVDQIDFRVQSINKGGYATILAYKDARCDMQRLDSVCGPMNWKREHSRDNHNCTVSIWKEGTNAFAGQWVGKEDTGTESNTESQKGLASDSFKRACFNWGIGRELYDYPVMQVKLNAQEFKDGKATWNFKLREWIWYSEFTAGKLSFIAGKDEQGALRFKYGTMKAKSDG